MLCDTRLSTCVRSGGMKQTSFHTLAGGLNKSPCMRSARHACPAVPHLLGYMIFCLQKAILL